MITYYLWKDSKDFFFITDYKEIREDGKVKIDNFGFLEVELVFSSVLKFDLIGYAERYTIAKNKK